MQLIELKELLENINNIRPFTAYIHGTKDGNFVNSMLSDKVDFKIFFDRNNIFSTFANCGTANTDIVSRIANYYYSGSNFNVVMIVPDAIKISKYCGCVLGQEKTTTGYTNYTEVDYQVMAFNDYIQNRKLLNNSNCTISNFHCDKVNNKLILGYLNKKTNEFFLNNNCVLFENDDEYKNICENTKKNVNLIYFEHIRLYLYMKYMKKTENNKAYNRVLNIIKNEKNFKDFINFANDNYILSDEFYLDAHNENLNFMNKLNFASNIFNSLNEYIELNLDEIEI